MHPKAKPAHHSIIPVLGGTAASHTCGVWGRHFQRFDHVASRIVNANHGIVAVSDDTLHEN